MHSLLGREKKEEEAGFGIELGLSQGFLPQAATMFSCVGCFWVLLSSALVAVCSFSFISPAWIVKDQLRNNHHPHHQHHHNNNKDSVSFGLLWHCSESLDHISQVDTANRLTDSTGEEKEEEEGEMGQRCFLHPRGELAESAGSGRPPSHLLSGLSLPLPPLWILRVLQQVAGSGLAGRQLPAAALDKLEPGQLQLGRLKGKAGFTS
ncbi:hypothetical protein D9C73_017691 [Collichthys lucidus]|uniref:Uncharacterized protein n=1 Tax=Collichthys lucidus TaxID=240159 RepID=A0A4U5V7E1_COLLU|nr:hypothetical protein D9C73_017691 [Collichthys lucidus]